MLELDHGHTSMSLDALGQSAQTGKVIVTEAAQLAGKALAAGLHMTGARHGHGEPTFGSHGEPPALVVAVHEQPVDGQANAAVTEALAAALGIRRRDVKVIAGHTNRTKTVEIMADDGHALKARIAELLLA